VSGPVWASSSKGRRAGCRGARDDLVDELVGDALLDDQPRPGGAHLAGVQEDRGQGVVEGGLAIGVGEDDVGVLAAEFERGALDTSVRPRP
jgi:hypothetical protein